MELDSRIPWVQILGLIAAIVGAVIVVVHPATLAYPQYLKDLGIFIGGSGVLIFARAEAGKESTDFLGVLDALPWASIIAFIAVIAGAVVVVVEPSTLDFSEWLKNAGYLLVGAGIFGVGRNKAKMGRRVRRQ